jgi:HEAT repeat protein
MSGDDGRPLLPRMADTPVVDAIVANYDAATTEEMVQRLTQLVSNIQSPKATEALLALAGHTTAAPQDGLQRAALDALARIGDPQSVSYLLRRLEASAPARARDSTPSSGSAARKPHRVALYRRGQ